MKMTFGLLVVLATFSVRAADPMDCNGISQKKPSLALEKLAVDVDKVLSKSYKSVMGIKVNYGGEGDLSILTDDKTGAILGIRFVYNDKDTKKDFTITVDELNKGKSLEYTSPEKGKPSPLRLSVTVPPGVTLDGGTFKLDIATSLSPLKLKTFTIPVKKKNDNWTPEYQGKEIKKAILSPGISWMSWDGTFKDAEFK